MKLFSYGVPLLSAAVTRAERMGALRNSITSGQGNLVGFIGEEVFRTIKGGEYSPEDGTHYQWDIVTRNGKTVDVKTKSCTGEPEGHYNATVADFNTEQACDIYAFMRVEVGKESGIPTGRAWYMGAILKDDFYARSHFWRKGEVDPTSDFGWRFKADCHNLRYDKLWSN